MDSALFRRQPQQQRSQARLEQILRAAAEVFWELGYEAATTHDIAARAQTAVGTIYRFFPNKLAIFHALEQQHRQNLERIVPQLLTPELMQKPLRSSIQEIVETYAEYFADPAPRVVYIQYFLTPDIFCYFDDSFNWLLIRRFATLLRSRNPALSIEKSELLAQVVHNSYNALMVVALRSDAARRDRLYQEIQDLLVNYLQPYASERPDVNRVAPVIPGAPDPLPPDLHPRQQKALQHLEQHGSLTIQDFAKLCPERSRRTLQRDLKQLVTLGLLRVEGDTNRLTYRLAAPAN